MTHTKTDLLCLVFLAGCGQSGEGPDAPDATTFDAAVDTSDAANVGELVTVELHYDDVSATYYYLTRIRHSDEEGTLLKLEHAQAVEDEGETVPEFASRIGTPRVAINASMGQTGLPPDIRKPVGIQIVDGTIVQEVETATEVFVLGIKDDNELVAYPYGTTAQAILDDGTNDALTAFVPLIDDHTPASSEVLETVTNLEQKHPRQVIAQLDNLDLLIMSVGGRGYGGEGMTALDLIRVLQFHEEDLKFAFNLDGGGSVTTVIDGERITPQIDGNGTLDRPRPNFLYVE